MSKFGLAFDFPGCFWDDESVVIYDERALNVKNGNKHRSHSITITCKDEREFRPAFKSACRFLNEFSWLNKLPVIHTACANCDCDDISTMPREENFFIHTFKQKVLIDEAHLALGFFREGLSSNSPFYRFISYFKIIELVYPQASKRKQWVSKQVGGLTESKLSVERLERARVKDVGTWLYEEGRCALAHAGSTSKTVRDICNFDHWQDIVWGSEIVKEMATGLIINYFNVPAN